MKTFKTITIRLTAGILFTALLLTGLFKLTLSFIPIWGATENEIALRLPGDELVADPNLRWTNSITIDASAEEVWPWIVQIGDTRGGFYSYTFIENQVGALTGAEDYTVTYTNANEIYPEWQHPQADLPIIQGMLKIREYKAGEYLLADSIQPSPFLWIWCWYVQPVDDDTTRLISRFAIDVPEGAAENPVMDFMLNAGGFVMHQNMMQSIKLRAEGGTEPAWIESVEIGLWLLALLSGLVAGILYLIRKDWRIPLGIASLAVVIIFVLTFIQPSIVIRLILDTGLVAAVVWSARKTQIQKYLWS
jgi:hypothetical protein